MPGGAANVGRNLSGIGGHVSLIGCIGNDRAGKSLTDALSISPQIGFFPIVCDDRPTTQKSRFLASGQQMLRVDDEVTRPLTDTQTSHLLTQAESVLEDSELLIISDYAKGAITKNLMEKIIMLCNEKNKIIVIDPKPKHKMFYKNATLIAPNHKEAHEMNDFTGDSPTDADIENIGKKLLKELMLVKGRNQKLKLLRIYR